MHLATHRWAALLLLVALVSTPALAQSDPLGDEFILFVDGTNVLVPAIDGAETDEDPLDATNTVVKFSPGNWAEGGFAWERNMGVDASASVGAAAGEGDTLYFRMLSDPANMSLTGISIMIADATADDGRDRATVEAAVAGGEEIPDYQMRLVWPIAPELHDGQWHEFAIPLPPTTFAALEAAKTAGELADGAELWEYTGAWSSGGFGIGPVGGMTPDTDPLWVEFGWDQVYRIGPFWDNAAGGTGGPIYLDDVYIGGPDTDLGAASEPGPAMSGVTFAPDGNTNKVSWSEIDGVGGYNVYTSLDPITDVDAAGVILLKRVVLGEPTELAHRYEIPHPSLGAPELHYAVTSLSLFGVENKDIASSAGSVVNGDLDVRGYVRQLTDTEANALFDDVAGGNASSANFPSDQPMFVLDSSHSTYTDGSNPPDDDNDSSAQFMIGYSDLEEWFIYGEVSDDLVVFTPEGTVGSESYLYDSIELAFGHYDVRTVDGGDLLNGSPHQDFERGDEPDYQIRITGRVSPTGDLVGTSTWVGFSINEDFENATAVERTDTGWKFLTLLPMDQIQAPGDALLPVPDASEIQFIPLTFSINDADATGQRETQIILSVKPNVTNQWWNTPAQYEVVAIAGRDVTTAEDGAPNGEGFSLAQSVPNPTSGATEIAFTLGTPGPVQLDVFNTLGQRVASVANAALAAGEQSITLDTSGLASGVYIYRLTAGDYVATRRMTVVR